MTTSTLFLDTKFITTEHLDKETDFVYQGDIYKDNSRNELFVKGVPVCKEVKTFDELSKLYLNEELKTLNNTFKNKYRVRQFLDGTMLRVYYDFDMNEWKLSTNRCLNAFVSKWSNMYSFGDYFRQLLMKKVNFDESMNIELSKILDDYLLLNNQYIYYFLIGSKDMKVVEPIEEDYIYLLYVLERKKDDHLNYNYFNVVDVIVPYISYVPSIDYDFETKDLCLNELKRGLLIENENKRYVWFFEDYQTKRKQHGRNKYLGLTLIELLNKNDIYKDEYFLLNPEHKEYCKDIYNAKLMFCSEAHLIYKKRYIQKQFIKVSAEIHYFVKKLYEKYITVFKKTKINKPTLLKDVIDFYDNDFNKYSKFIFIRSKLYQLNPQLTGNNNIKKKNIKKTNKISNSPLNKSQFIICESEFPPLTNV